MKQGTQTRGERAATQAGLVEVAFDPITRIVGNLGIYTKIDFANGQVAECRSTSSIFRGYSVFMKGKDPRDAHFITSRICGICGDNHAVCSIYAQNMAYGIKPPPLAEWIVNLGEAAEYMFDHTLFQDNLVFVDFCERMVAETNPGLLATAKKEDDVELLEDIEADDSEAAKQAQEATVVGLVNKILTEAAGERASDIHIEHEEHGLKIRYRIDGLLQEQRLPEGINRWQAAIVSRLKIMARLNIAEKRLPQDGRIKMKVQGREVDVRVSIIPMVHGEGIVMRLLDKGRMVFNLKNIGFLPDYDKKFRQMIDRPHGIVIVTGPTGSGKSTTLYSALNEVKEETTKIITVEDPVEYQQPGISQIQTHAKIGLTFATALRSILRHDPDVILIGEMRDLETAEAAIQASLTGHLVFSTLHTNDAPSAFTRLIDMKVEPFLVASTVEGVLAQRLVRTICPDCKTTYTPTADAVPLDFPKLNPDTGESWDMLYKGDGCRSCRNTGYRGRTGIHELLVNTDVVRDLIVQRVNASVIRMEALKAGMRTLRQDGFYKCINGTTTLDEVGRTTAGDIS